ncbi:MAG TPA: hypothetical protein VJ992_04515 [Gemmatimonadales bacterium]|nr:hypothetical protein [Gemmatimonadales bacterium]
MRGLRTLVALAGLIGVAACHRAEQPAQSAAAAPAAPAAAQDTGTTPEWTPPAGAKPRPEIVAFHAPHHAIECARCHGTPRGHSTHHDVPCVACHVRPTEYAGLKPLPIAQCRSCHHGADQTRTCAHCHPLDTRSNVIEVTTTFDPTVAKAPTKRTLGFNHVWHDSLACANCHTHTLDEAVTRECRSCHARHHTPTATCARCHDAEATLAKHTLVVHTGCGQAGCHADGVASHFPPTRAVCLSCHAAQVNHRPGGDCATCHQIRAGWKQ